MRKNIRFTFDVIGLSDQVATWIKMRLQSMQESLKVVNGLEAVLVVTPLEVEDEHQDQDA